MKYRIERRRKGYEVQTKKLFFWKDGFISTGFFEMYYETKEEAIEAIEEHKDRFTYVGTTE